MITTFYPPYAFGGDAVFVQRLSHMLARHGHEVEVIHCIDSYRALAKAPFPAVHPDANGVTVHGLTSGFRALSPLATQQTGYPFFKGRKIREILSAKRFDVIHFHNISLIGGPKILGYGDGVKLYTIHEHWLICPMHTLFKFNRKACAKPDCFRCTLIHQRPPQLWRYTNLLKQELRQVDAFISPTKYAMNRHLLDGLDVPVVHIPHGIPEEDLASAGAQDAVELPLRPFFLFVGRIEKMKGLQTIIPIFRDYESADLVVAGDGNYVERVKKLAAGCDRIHFFGFLTSDRLRTLYRRAVALIVPSIGFEVFPQVIIEAFAARTPVIVRDLGPLPELVADSGGGLVFRDDRDLVDALERLRTDRELRDRLGEAGYRTFRSQWTEDVHLERYLSLIEEIRENKRRGAGTGKIAV